MQLLLIKNADNIQVDSSNLDNSLKNNLEEFEKALILDVLKKNNGDVQTASNVLGVGLKTLYRKIKKYEINK